MTNESSICSFHLLTSQLNELSWFPVFHVIENAKYTYYSKFTNVCWNLSKLVNVWQSYWM